MTSSALSLLSAPWAGLWLRLMLPCQTLRLARPNLTRRKRMNDEDLERMSKLIRAKRCDLWPDCSCPSTLVHWQQKLLHDYKGWSYEQLRWAETSIFITLSCVEKRCPDRKI